VTIRIARTVLHVVSYGESLFASLSQIYTIAIMVDVDVCCYCTLLDSPSFCGLRVVSFRADFNVKLYFNFYYFELILSSRTLRKLF